MKVGGEETPPSQAPNSEVSTLVHTTSSHLITLDHDYKTQALVASSFSLSGCSNALRCHYAARRSSPTKQSSPINHLSSRTSSMPFREGIDLLLNLQQNSTKLIQRLPDHWLNSYTFAAPLTLIWLVENVLFDAVRSCGTQPEAHRAVSILWTKSSCSITKRAVTGVSLRLTRAFIIHAMQHDFGLRNITAYDLVLKLRKTWRSLFLFLVTFSGASAANHSSRTYFQLRLCIGS